MMKSRYEIIQNQTDTGLFENLKSNVKPCIYSLSRSLTEILVFGFVIDHTLKEKRYEIAGFFMFSEFLNEYKTSIKPFVYYIT